VLSFPVWWGIDGIWLSVIVAEALAAAVAVMFVVTLRKKYKY
jgi:Na+-driven multidrug efflux pump